MLEPDRQWRVVIRDFEILTHRDAALALSELCTEHGTENYVYRRTSRDSDWMLVP
jgi:hypothetical protein